MAYLLLGVCVFVIPVVIVLRPFTWRRGRELLLLKPSAVCLLLLAGWCIEMLADGTPMTLILPLAISLAVVLLEDFDRHLISVGWLALATSLLVIKHLLIMLSDWKGLVTDHAIAGGLALTVLMVARAITLVRGQPAIGSADIPLIFGLGLTMAPAALLLWVNIFCLAALVGFVGSNLQRQISRPAGDGIQSTEIPLAPYMIASAAVVHLMG